MKATQFKTVAEVLSKPISLRRHPRRWFEKPWSVEFTESRPEGTVLRQWYTSHATCATRNEVCTLRLTVRLLDSVGLPSPTLNRWAIERLETEL